MRKHQRVINDRQIEILYLLAVNGQQTKTQLANEFGVKYPAIFDSVKILEEKFLVKVSFSEEGRGKAKLFYEITNEGLETLSKDSRITLERFWKIAFCIFDMKTNSSISISLEKVFSNYETVVLGYDLKYTPVYWSIILECFDLYNPVDRLTPDISILYTLGMNGEMEEGELIKLLDSSKNNYIITSKKIEYELILKNMITGKLVMKVEKKKSIKYRNSILGLLILMSYMNKIRLNPDKPTYEKFESEIKTIFQNSKTIIPYIAKSWNKLRKVIREIDVIQYFMWIANNHMPISRSIQVDGIRELIVTERIMGETNKLVIEKEVKVGFQIIKELSDSGRYQEGKPSNVYNRLLLLAVLSGYSIENQSEFLKSMKGTEYSLDFAIERAISNLVCFEFFTYFIDGVKTRKRIAGDATESTGNWAYFAIKNWKEFLKNNREFRLWYTSWIEQITKFEEKNLEILKQRDFLTV